MFTAPLVLQPSVCLSQRSGLCLVTPPGLIPEIRGAFRTPLIADFRSSRSATFASHGRLSSEVPLSDPSHFMYQDSGVPGPSSVQCLPLHDDEVARRSHRARVDADSRAQRGAYPSVEPPLGRSRSGPAIPFTIPSAVSRENDTRPPGVMIVAFASFGEGDVHICLRTLD